MPENEMWKSINFALTMAFMGDIARDNGDKLENDIRLFGLKTELHARMDSLVCRSSENKNPYDFERAENMSRMLLVSMLYIVAKKAENGAATAAELFSRLNEGLDLGLDERAAEALESDEDEAGEALKKSIKSLILMGIRSENMTDVLYLFKALAGLSRVAEETLGEYEELVDVHAGAAAAELGELALDASEMARAEAEGGYK